MIKDLKMGVTMPCYSGEKEKSLAAIDNLLPGIMTYLGDKKFLTGESPTWIDFYFFELVELMNFVKDGLMDEYPGLKEYKSNVENLPKLKEYLADPNCPEKKKSFNNKAAMINNM